MSDFAKLYRAEDTGQVLVVLDSEDGPEIRISFKPEGLGVCTLKLGFSDTDAGWGKAEDVFNNRASEEWALGAVRKALADLPLDSLSGN